LLELLKLENDFIFVLDKYQYFPYYGCVIKIDIFIRCVTALAGISLSDV